MPTYFAIQSESACVTLAPPRPIQILRAGHLGMCFGVRDAIALARREAAVAPFTLLGDLVHNETVLADLRRRGVVMERNPATVATATVMITAHGASQRTLCRLRERGLRVVEATCPLVRHAQRCARELAEAGYHPVIVGQRDHVEVRGITEDLDNFDVVLTPDDVSRLAERARFGVVAQTTQPVEKARSLAALIQRRFPRSEVRFVDTVCRFIVLPFLSSLVSIRAVSLIPQQHLAQVRLLQFRLLLGRPRRARGRAMSRTSEADCGVVTTDPSRAWFSAREGRSRPHRFLDALDVAAAFRTRWGGP